jgi:hypothetical protein
MFCTSRTWLARRSIGPVEWSGGHPALDLVNTLDERSFDQLIENLACYRDLVRFAELAGLIKPALAATLQTLTGPACSRVAKRARELREHAHGVLAAVHKQRPMSQRDLDAIASAVRAARAARVLVASSSGGLATYQWSRPAAAEIPLHACALAVEGLISNQFWFRPYENRQCCERPLGRRSADPDRSRSKQEAAISTKYFEQSPGPPPFSSIRECEPVMHH